MRKHLSLFASCALAVMAILAIPWGPAFAAPASEEWSLSINSLDAGSPITDLRSQPSTAFYDSGQPVVAFNFVKPPSGSDDGLGLSDVAALTGSYHVRAHEARAGVMASAFIALSADSFDGPAGQHLSGAGIRIKS